MINEEFRGFLTSPAVVILSRDRKKIKNKVHVDPQLSIVGSLNSVREARRLDTRIFSLFANWYFFGCVNSRFANKNIYVTEREPDAGKSSHPSEQKWSTQCGLRKIVPVILHFAPSSEYLEKYVKFFEKHRFFSVFLSYKTVEAPVILCTTNFLKSASYFSTFLKNSS